jgi:type III pantothenate kinase
MNLLLLDVGNSRIKWAALRQSYRRGADFAVQGVMELKALRASIASWSRLFQVTGKPDTIYTCNVAGAAMERQIRAASTHAGAGSPHFARSAAAAAGVRNAYPEPWRLGVDRWVQLIGAHHEHPGKDLCLVSLGTAMTIDLLNAAGRHLGGSIVPGPRLMIESLMEGTAGIRRRAGGRAGKASFDLALGAGQPLSARGVRRGKAARSRSSAKRTAPVGLFAHDTHAALLAGARHACAGLIEHALREGRSELGRRPRLILAGGAADAITPLLHGPYFRADDLVLRGLAVLATGAQTPDRIKSPSA